MEIFLNVVFLALGFVMLWKGADWFVDGASAVASKFGIPQIIIGLTIVAMGTSAPEACVSIMGSIQGNGDIAVGNVVGSNVLNVLIILGLSAVVLPLIVQKNTVYIEVPFVIAVTVILLLLGLDGKIGRIDGVIFLLLFIVYLVYLYICARKNKEEPLEEPEKQKPLGLSILFTVLGLAIVIAGSQFTVDTATFLAKKIGLSERIIGLTIIAIGTALPELVTTIIATFQKDTALAVGNLIGSCMLNLWLILGLGAVITPLVFSIDFNLNLVLLTFATLMVWLFCYIGKKDTITSANGLILLFTFCYY